MDTPDKRSLQSGIDELFNSALEYRSSKRFSELLRFCARFKRLAPYNAALVAIQKPGARFVLSAREWRRRYNRVPKTDSRPVIVLQPFGPVAYLFDVGDTVSLSSSEDLFPRELSHPYDGDPTQEVSETTRRNILRSIAFYGVAFVKMRSAPSYSGKIQTGGNTQLRISLSKDVTLPRMPNYTLSVRDASTPVEDFSAIIHELGHLFCQHLPSTYKDKKWETRSAVSQSSKEFEAETVSWLVCQRLGINDTRAYAYLANYLGQNKDMPTISMDMILGSVRTIEQMLDSRFPVAEGFLYKFDKGFRDAVREARSVRHSKTEIVPNTRRQLTLNI